MDARAMEAMLIEEIRKLRGEVARTAIFQEVMKRVGQGQEGLKRITADVVRDMDNVVDAIVEIANEEQSKGKADG